MIQTRPSLRRGSRLRRLQKSVIPMHYAVDDGGNQVANAWVPIQHWTLLSLNSVLNQQHRFRDLLQETEFPENILPTELPP